MVIGEASGLITVLARSAPGGLAESLGLRLDPATVRLAATLPGARLVLADGAGARTQVSLALAAPLRAKGLVVPALPSGQARRPYAQLSWGGLHAALSRRSWPGPAQHSASRLAVLAAAVQVAVDEASVTKPETGVAELVSSGGLLPGAARLAAAVLSGLIEAGAGRDVGIEALAGPSRRPAVRLSRWLSARTSVQAELSLGPAGVQLVLLVSQGAVWGPTWQRRHRDPQRYVAALSQVVPEATAQLASGGWLGEGGHVLEGKGWRQVEGQPDRLLLRRAGVHTTLVLRPPSAAGLLWLAPSGADLGLLVATMADLARLVRSKPLRNAARLLP